MGEGNKGFHKILNTVDIIFVAFGAMIGWGWVVSSGTWIRNSGVIGTMIAFVIGGIMIFLVGLTYAELTTAYPKVGGAGAFAGEAFGHRISGICTWMMLLSYVSVVCFEAVSFPTILQYLFPGFLKGYLYTVAGFDIYLSWLLCAVAMAVFITALNIIGTKKAAVLQNILTVVIAVVGLILFASSLFTGKSSNIAGNAFSQQSEHGALIGIAKVAMVTPFFFFGFDVIPQACEEVNVPVRKLGKMMMLSIVLAVVFYVMVVFSVGFIMDYTEIGESMRASGLVTADAMSKAFSSEMMAKVLILGGLAGIITSWNSFMIGASRVLYFMAEEKMIAGSFSKLTGKSRTPIVALIFVGVLSIASAFLGRTALVWVSDAGSLACSFTYFVVAVSFLRLRRTQPSVERPYKIRFPSFVGLLAAVLSGGMVLLYVIPGTPCALTKEETIITVGWILLGILLALIRKGTRKN